MADNVNKRDFDKNVKSQIEDKQFLIKLQKMEYEGITNIFNLEARRQKALLDIRNEEIEQHERKKQYLKLQEQVNNGEVSVGKTTMANIKKQMEADQKHINTLKTKSKILSSISKIDFSNLVNTSSQIVTSFSAMDKPIRETVLQLGYGAEKAQLIRDSFYDAAPKAMLLGANLKDLASIQQGYVEQSGRALALSSDQLLNITEIGKGTGLAVDGAAKLVAQFEMLGMDTQRSHETIQGIVDSSERMGVNSTKILKNISGNFKQLNTFAFKDGIKGMAKMAQYAEKFKVSFDESINSAGQARTLEGAIEMASQLQILGGEFAKSDPFELFHLSRNDPAKYTQRINEMVKGMTSLVKEGDEFVLKTSPQDMDRLKLAAEATGQSFESMVEQSQRMAEIQAMNKQMSGVMFDPKDREVIQAMAKLDSKSGIYTVLGKDISKLSETEIAALKVQQTTLKERAEAAQTFDEKFQNTIESLKYTLLPMLDGLQAVLDFIKPAVDGLTSIVQKVTGSELGKNLLGAAGAIAASVFVLSKIPGLGTLAKAVVGGGKGLLGGAAKAATGGGGAAGGAGGGGMAALGKGAGVGVAAAGIGAGIGLAAAGVAKLADAFKELDPKQLDALNDALKTLGIVMVTSLVGGLIAVSIAGPAATVPLLALGAAALGIGAGIGLAAAGIGYMAKGFSELMTAAEPEKVFQLALGIGALGASMAALAGGSILTLFAGGGAFAMLGLLSTRANAFERIGNSMKEIGVVMNSDGSGIKELKKTLDSIQNIKTSGGIFGELKDMMKNGLKVEFKDKNVAMNVDVSLKVDSDTLARAVAKKIVVLHSDYQSGKQGA